MATFERSSRGTKWASSYPIALPDGHSWKDLLRAVEATSPARPLIVTDRLADERLWGEVLNLGAYDLLTKPFRPEEVFRVISLAWQSWRSRLERAHAQRRPAAQAREVQMPYAAQK